MSFAGWQCGSFEAHHCPVGDWTWDLARARGGIQPTSLEMRASIGILAIRVAMSENPYGSINSLPWIMLPHEYTTLGT